MTIRRRLERLENTLAIRFSAVCAHCRDWPMLHIEEKTVAEVLAGQESEVPCCPQCGRWQRVITEIVVESREEVDALNRHKELMDKAGDAAMGRLR
jgi:hypothetical protein